VRLFVRHLQIASRKVDPPGSWLPAGHGKGFPGLHAGDGTLPSRPAPARPQQAPHEPAAGLWRRAAHLLAAGARTSRAGPRPRDGASSRSL